MGFLSRLFRSDNAQKSDTGQMSLEEEDRIVNEFGAVLLSSGPAPGTVADDSKLPFPKAKIKTAIVTFMRETEDEQSKEQLKAGYIMLADWQEGVGDEVAGLDFSTMDLDGDPMELAKRITEKAGPDEKFLAVAQRERELLQAELNELGL